MGVVRPNTENGRINMNLAQLGLNITSLKDDFTNICCDLVKSNSKLS